MNSLYKHSLFALLFAAFSQYFLGTVNLYNYVKYFTNEESMKTSSCVRNQCSDAFFSCIKDFSCIKTLGCVTRCGATETRARESACSYVCEMTHGYENKQFEDLLKCMVNEKCFASYPDDGICHGEDKDGVKTLDSLEKIAGDWWVIGGLNCGQDDTYPGGYDWYPCQHERFTYQAAQNQWINNVTYCDGKDNTCTSDFIVTVANVSLPAPGVVRHDYTDAPLSPQQEFWRIVSWPEEGEYLLMLWCGRLPILNYNGGIVLSRKRSGNEMPKTVLEEFRTVAKRFGLDYDTFCFTDNTWCPL